jgi:hypothetical protein
MLEVTSDLSDYGGSLRSLFKRDRRALARLATNPRRDLPSPVSAGSGQTLLREFIWTF